MQSMFQDFQRMQQMLHQNQLQLEKTLGQVEEMRRHGADHRANQPQPLNIPMYQGVAAPSPMAPPPAPVVPATFQGMNPQDFQTLMAFIQQQNGSTNPFGVGASPQPPPQQFQPQQQVQQPQQQQYPQQQMVPQQANSLDQIKQMVETMTGMSKAMADIRRAVAPEEEEVGPAPFVPDATGAMVPAQQQQAQEEGPFKTMPLGFGKDPAMLAYNPDGSVHVVGTLIGNIPKIAGFMEGVSKMLMTAQNAQNAQMQQQFVQHEQSPRQLSQAAEEMPVITAQETNFMPSADSIRQAMGR